MADGLQVRFECNCRQKCSLFLVVFRNKFGIVVIIYGELNIEMVKCILKLYSFALRKKPTIKRKKKKKTIPNPIVTVKRHRTNEVSEVFMCQIPNSTEIRIQDVLWHFVCLKCLRRKIRLWMAFVHDILCAALKQSEFNLSTHF